MSPARRAHRSESPPAAGPGDEEAHAAEAVPGGSSLGVAAGHEHVEGPAAAPHRAERRSPWRWWDREWNPTDVEIIAARLADEDNRL
jgi:hypothetical protein